MIKITKSIVASNLTIILILKAHFIFAIITVISLIIYIMFMTKNMDKYSKYLKEQKKHNDTINLYG